MRTAGEMSRFCADYCFLNHAFKKAAQDAYISVAGALQAGETVFLAFVGLQNFISPQSNGGRRFYAISDRRLLVGSGADGQPPKSILLERVRRITVWHEADFSVICVEAPDELLYIAVNRTVARRVDTMWRVHVEE